MPGLFITDQIELIYSDLFYGSNHYNTLVCLGVVRTVLQFPCHNRRILEGTSGEGPYCRIRRRRRNALSSASDDMGNSAWVRWYSLWTGRIPVPQR